MKEYVRRLPRSIQVIVMICIALLIAACSSTVVRENIISTIDTGLGLTVAENKQTQLYELKAGYIRSQFYSIPTGKVVESDNASFNMLSTCRKIARIPVGTITDSTERTKVFSLLSSCVTGNHSQASNAANITPEVISGIHANMGLQDIIFGMEVSESFAVGKEAVNSPAAVAMYVANAKTKEAAQSASDAVGYASLKDPDLIKDQRSLDTLLGKKLKAGARCNDQPFAPEKTRECADSLAAMKGKTLKTLRRIGGKYLEELIDQLEKVTE